MSSKSSAPGSRSPTRKKPSTTRVSSPSSRPSTTTSTPPWPPPTAGPPNLLDEAILERLVALNHERAAEEAQGFIRYLRPEYQNPEGVAQMALDVTEVPPRYTTEKVAKQPWPTTLPERIQAVQRVLAASGRPATAADLAGRFKRAQKKQVQTLLETLEALGHVRRTDDGRFIG